MSTRHSLGGRSLHRWVVGFPVLFFTLTFAFFGVYALEHDGGWLRAAFMTNIAAILAAVGAGALGLLDFRGIPARHPARTLAVAHATLNSASIALLIGNLVMHEPFVAAALRNQRDVLLRFEASASLTLTGIVLAITVVSGAIGFRMAHHHRVGRVPVLTRSSAV
ncbi:MAG: DUF2231 domain-containing protein [Deltaproteobacteria bacterium]|nr:DUF2231 domain-containing protein [Deltaproteobacteria bacterium]